MAFLLEHIKSGGQFSLATFGGVSSISRGGSSGSLHLHQICAVEVSSTYQHISKELCIITLVQILGFLCAYPSHPLLGGDYSFLVVEVPLLEELLLRIIIWEIYLSFLHWRFLIMASTIKWMILAWPHPFTLVDSCEYTFHLVLEWLTYIPDFHF